MKWSIALRGSIPVLMVAFMLSACGGGSSGGGSGDGAPGPGPGPGPSNPGPDAPPDTQARSACQNDFTTARASSNTSQCVPRYFDYCPSVAETGEMTFDSVPPCNGVITEAVSISHPDSFSGTLDYIVMRPASGTPKAAVVALHFRQLLRSPQRAAATHAALMRQTELVQARNVMVILPGAPGGNWPQSTLSDTIGDLASGVLLSELIDELIVGGLLEGDLFNNPIVDELVGLGVPIGALEDLLTGLGTVGDLAELIGSLAPVAGGTMSDYLDYIDLAMEDAFDRFGGRSLPRFMSGLSNGGIYALRYACQRGGLEGILAVAASIGPMEGPDCQKSLKAPLGTVQVHGRADVLVPYVGTVVYPVRGGGGKLLDDLPLIGDLVGGLSPLDLLPLQGSLMEGLLGGLLDSLLPGGNPLAPLQQLLDSVLSLGGLLNGLLPGPNQAGLFLDVFGPNNACAVNDINTTVLPAGIAGRGTLAGDVTIEEFVRCDNPAGKKSYMVTVERGGHNWPGYDAPSDAEVNIFGPISRDFDTTLYGFDLMWAASGR